MSNEHKEIWLQPWCDGCETHCESDNGRLWCQDNVWDKCDECGNLPVRYVIAPPTQAQQMGSDR